MQCPIVLARLSACFPIRCVSHESQLLVPQGAVEKLEFGIRA